MTKKIWLPRGNSLNGCGIDVTWTPSQQRLDFGAFYDTFVGIPGDSMSLREFFDCLGITQKDCNNAWKEPIDGK